jgi:hypothetical protein
MYILDNPADALDRVAPRTRGAGALLRLALRPADGHHRLVGGVLHLGDRDLKPPSLRRYAYPSLVLTEVWLPRRDALDLLRRLPGGEDVQLPGIGLAHFPTTGANTQRYSSGSNVGLLWPEWPVVLSEWHGNSTSADQLDAGWRRLLARGLPLYPNEKTAVLSFVHGYTEGYGSTVSPSLFRSYCEDRRARISRLELQGGILNVSVEHQSRLSCRVLPYGGTVPERSHAEGVAVREGSASIPLDGARGYLLIGIADERGELLDERTLDFTAGLRASGVSVAPEEEPRTPDIVVRGWINGGENERVEFKETFKGKSQGEKDQLLETIVAFANGGGGSIILGVDDNAMPRGFRDHAFADTLTNMVHSRCSPRPSYELEDVQLDGLPLTVIRVAGRFPGVQYALDGDKFYVRVGATDRLARREDLAILFRPVEPPSSLTDYPIGGYPSFPRRR